MKTSRIFILEWWRVVPEPRAISVITTMLYVTMLSTGVLTLFFPPRTLLGAVGEVTILAISWLFILGSVVAMVGCARDFWQLERIGVSGTLLGLLAYAAIVGTLHVVQDGSRVTQLGVIFAAIFGLVLRYALIWRYPFRPEIDRIREELTENDGD